MVTLFGDRISWALLAQVSRVRDRLNSRSDRAASTTTISSAPIDSAVHRLDAMRSARRITTCQPRHAAGLARVRHVWYRGAVERDPAYDAHYFVRTGEWVEPRCEDAQCAFCKDRPERHTAR
jgi:hypothetical protein